MTIAELLSHVLVLAAIAWLVFVFALGLYGLDILLRWIFS